MSLFKRNLAKCGQTVTIQTRDIRPPNAGSADFDEEFTNDINRPAIIKTVSGRTFFDGVSAERLVTHEMHIEYESTVTAESWILFKGRRIDILTVENCCEKDKTMILTCSDRGVGEAAKV